MSTTCTSCITITKFAVPINCEKGVIHKNKNYPLFGYVARIFTMLLSMCVSLDRARFLTYSQMYLTTKSLFQALVHD